MLEHRGGQAISSIDTDEIARFEAQAARWWDPDGDAKPLHRINPVRLQFIRDGLARHFARNAHSIRPFAGLTLVDVGCGGGIVAEPLTRLGFRVTGIDVGDEMLSVARAHAAETGLEIDYRKTNVEDLARAGARFDAVLALEIVEHVSDVDAFLGSAATLVGPGGALIASTFNRTTRSFLLGVVAAEHLLRWVPRGTHDWRRFRRPSELAAALRRHGLRLDSLAGMTYDPTESRWSLTSDIGVNYLLLATRPARQPQCRVAIELAAAPFRSYEGRSARRLNAPVGSGRRAKIGGRGNPY